MFPWAHHPPPAHWPSCPPHLTVHEMVQWLPPPPLLPHLPPPSPLWPMIEFPSSELFNHHHLSQALLPPPAQIVGSGPLLPPPPPPFSVPMTIGLQVLPPSPPRRARARRPRVRRPQARLQDIGPRSTQPSRPSSSALFFTGSRPRPKSKSSCLVRVPIQREPRKNPCHIQVPIHYDLGQGHGRSGGTPSSPSNTIENRLLRFSGSLGGIEAETVPGPGPDSNMFPFPTAPLPYQYGLEPPQYYYNEYFQPYVQPEEPRQMVNSAQVDGIIMEQAGKIYPTPDELQAIQTVVSNCELVLKLVAHQMLNEDLEAIKMNGNGGVKEGAGKEEGSSESILINSGEKAEVSVEDCKMLKGVMRVGLLAKGLLLQGDHTVELVVICATTPTVTLLSRVANLLPLHLERVVTNDTYLIELEADEARLSVTSHLEPQITVYIMFTSPVVRRQLLSPNTEESKIASDSDSTAVNDPPPSPPSDEALNKEKCLEALAHIRHAKWFQAKATPLTNCVLIIRLLRDLGRRVPAWRGLKLWVLELLVHQVITASTGRIPVGPGAALKLIFESIASGLILKCGPGILDPCESDRSDVFKSLSIQTRDEVTSQAQEALRRMQFDQIKRVLGLEEIPPILKKKSESRKRKGTGDSQNKCGSTSSSSSDSSDNESVPSGIKEYVLNRDFSLRNPIVKSKYRVPILK